MAKIILEEPLKTIVQVKQDCETRTIEEWRQLVTNNGFVFQPGEKIRTLGLYQPYATLMLHGKIETRWIRKGRKPPFPLGKYLIYSTKKSYTPTEVSLISGYQYRAVQKKTMYDSTKDLHGYAIGFGELKKLIYIVEGMSNATFVKDETHHDFVRIGLIFDKVQRIKPFPIRGKQGVGFCTQEQIDQIEFI